LWLPVTPESLFLFFTDAANLDAITPPWLHFEILTPLPITMREGALIDYRLRLRGIPLRWRTRINLWRPPQLFVDEQIRGPYRKWVHEHVFEPKDGGTSVRDKVRYAVSLDFVVNQWLVRPDIERIFQFRAEALKRRFRSQG
jgi:ligand-binding SRPBCC domain-containing protein